MTPLSTVLVAAMAAGLPVIVALIGATWHLSDKIGGLRVSIASLNEKEAANKSQIDSIWDRCFPRRSCRSTDRSPLGEELEISRG
jgi:hypothetical protein